MSDKKKASGRGKNPNSIKNLKPVQPGEVRNPDGGRTHDPHMKAIKKLSNDYLMEVIDAAFMGDVDALGKMCAPGSKLPAIQVGVARVLFNAIKDGQWSTIEKVIERVLGKVPDKLDTTSNGKTIGQGGPFTVRFVKAETKK